jgi:hypothetical protein
LNGFDRPKIKETDDLSNNRSSDNLHRSFKPGDRSNILTDRSNNAVERGENPANNGDNPAGGSDNPADGGDSPPDGGDRPLPGDGTIPDRETLSQAGGEAYKNNLTRAGHEFQKHGNRSSGVWETPKGNTEQLNADGQRTLDGIIDSPDAEWQTRHHARFGDIVEARTQDGRGARWSSDGQRFHCFLDPETDR